MKPRLAARLVSPTRDRCSIGGPRAPLAAVLLVAAFAACSSSTPADSTGDVADAPDGGAAAPSTPDTAPGPDASSADDGGPETSDGPGIATATIVFDGATSTVVPNVRRGLAFNPPLAEKLVSAPYNQSLALSCAPAAPVADGGRALLPNLVTISGNITGNCAQNPGQIPGAEGQIRTMIRGACSGKSTCSFDPTSAMDTYLAECSPQNLQISVSYACPALDPAPSFVLEAAQPSIVVNALDGLGSATCAERSARFFVGGSAVVPVAETPCTIAITKRTDRAIAGTITATLPGSPNPRPLTIDFEHTRNRVRAVAGLHLGADVCVTNNVTHAVRTEDGETFDDFTTGPLVCSVQQPATPLSFTLSRRRPKSGSPKPQELDCGAGRLGVSIPGVGTTTAGSGGCQAAFAVSESEAVVQLVAHNVRLCDPASPASCEARPVAYLSFGFGDASAPPM